MKPTLTCLGFVLLLFVYSNCEKSNKTDFENYFKVAEKKIFITSGAMVKLLDNTFLKDMKAVLFASDGISFETKSENTLQIKDKGSLLGFTIHSNHEVESKNNRLEISLKRGVNIRNGHFEFNVPFESLSKIKLSGSGTIDTQDPITGKILEVSLSGSRDIELSGTSENLNLQISGSADYNGLALDTQNTSIEISRLGDANVVAHKTLNARISGLGSVHYKGKSDKINTKVS
ncbi:MAG: hypothetical protein HN443_09085 [Flavobacteriaceae bacterium]|nr:hypothetical protein [Flavobacteriaceae bacterium]